MNKSASSLHHQSRTGFVIIQGNSKEQLPAKWEWMTQKNSKHPNLLEQNSPHPRLSYSEKKRILTGLQPKSRVSSSFKIRDGFSLKQKARVLSTASCASIKTQRKLQPFVYLNSKQQQIDIPSINFGINQEELIKRMGDARVKGRTILGVISIRRLGLRYKLNQTFVQYCSKCKSKHNHDLKQISENVKNQMKEFSHSDKELYYFNTNGMPLHSYNDIIQSKKTVVIVDSMPKLQFSQNIYIKLIEQSQKIESIMIKLQRILKEHYKIKENGSSQHKEDDSEGQEEKYDYQKIKNVKQYVNKLSQNPQFKLKTRQSTTDQLLSWYQQKYAAQESANKQTDKNLLFQSKSHYPKQISNRKLLHMASDRVQTLPITTNRHKYIPQRIDLMMEHVKREEPSYRQKLNNDPSFNAPMTKRDMLAQLDRKNTLLSTQNIPYLIKKYGLNRFQIYNLYNLYKSFQKIAVMRSPNSSTMMQVNQKGIDRQTFQVGLKGLDMNPGDELIKNICHFGDFISWEHFIKIISISLRKTPEQKLTAILKGISSFDDGFLSRYQISLMIGNSLNKLFDHEQPQLKEYFTNMAIREFGPQVNGKISVQTLKAKVLEKGSENQNMVSFLILNT